MRTLLLSDAADFQHAVDQRLHDMLAQQWDEPQQYEPPTYPYHPHIRLRRNEVRWYHGTTATLPVGTTLLPGEKVGRDNFPGMGNSWGVWVTPSLALAAKYGPNIYEVEPVGTVTDWADENGWDRDENSDEYVCNAAVITHIIPPAEK